MPTPSQFPRLEKGTFGAHHLSPFLSKTRSRIERDSSTSLQTTLQAQKSIGSANQTADLQACRGSEVSHHFSLTEDPPSWDSEQPQTLDRISVLVRLHRHYVGSFHHAPRPHRRSGLQGQPHVRRVSAEAQRLLPPSQCRIRCHGQ